MIANLAKRFRFYPAEDQVTRDKHETVRMVCSTAATALDGLCPDGREKSLAMTALEEAMMWANAAIARDGAAAEFQRFA